jgi:hypothetical protein
LGFVLIPLSEEAPTKGRGFLSKKSQIKLGAHAPNNLDHSSPFTAYVQ